MLRGSAYVSTVRLVSEGCMNEMAHHLQVTGKQHLCLLQGHRVQETRRGRAMQQRADAGR